MKSPPGTRAALAHPMLGYPAHRPATWHRRSDSKSWSHSSFVTPVPPTLVRMAPIWAIVCAVAIRNAMLPITSSPIYLRCNRSTGRSPAAAPIPASPYCWAAWRDEDSALRHDNDSRWGYFYSARSLNDRRRGQSLCGRRWCRVEVGGIGGSQNCRSSDDGSRTRDREHDLFSSSEDLSGCPYCDDCQLNA
jgi:hypothetical protein